MRGKYIKKVLLSILLVFSLTLVNVTLASSTVLFVDPPEIVGFDAHVNSNFTVYINVTDVSDLFGWQANMSWNPAIVNITSAASITEGDFLGGLFPWDSHPYNTATEPFSQQTKVPNTNLTITPGWEPEHSVVFPPYPTLVECVQVREISKPKYASSNTTNSEQEWGDFDFNTGVINLVQRLEVGVYALTDEASQPEQDKIEITVTNNGGTTWSPAHTVDLFQTELLTWVDVTNDFAWTNATLTNASFKVRMKYQQVGATANVTKVNQVRARVTDTIDVEDPQYAYDKNIDTYASFAYSDTDGNFTIHDFSHDFPSGATQPIDENSDIMQVDFSMKYWANTSSAGDKYRISYYVHPNETETVLVDWTSAGAALATYTWSNQIEPDDGEWDWTDISGIRIMVKTDRDGGDSDAVFRAYEAWVTVTYERPTSMEKTMAHVTEGWCLFSVLTQGTYAGVSGDGTLASVEFEVLDYGETDLSITDPDRTWLKDADLEFITFSSEDGYFMNTIPGDIQGDTPGTLPDGDVDRYDFFAFSAAYLAHPGDPNWEPFADLQGDTPGTPPDGDVDRYDFFAFSANYLRTIY